MHAQLHVYFFVFQTFDYSNFFGTDYSINLCLCYLDNGGDNICDWSGDLPESDCDSSAEQCLIQEPGLPHSQCHRGSHTSHPHHAICTGEFLSSQTMPMSNHPPPPPTSDLKNFLKHFPLTTALYYILTLVPD